VLWPRDERRDPELSAHLQAEGWHLSEVDDPYLALSELCLLDRARKGRQAWGLATTERLGLFLPFPDDVSMQAPRLLSVAGRLIPDLSVHRGASCRQARKAEEGQARAEHDDAEPSTGEPAFLSREEIDMLLGDESPARDSEGAP